MVVSIDTVGKYVKDAAEQLLFTELRRIDKAYQKAGNRILFAVDTDMVVMYSSAKMHMVYASVFHDDDENTQKIISRALAHYIFEICGKVNRLLVIPPHNQELNNVMDQIIDQAAQETIRGNVNDTKESKQLSRILENYRATKDQQELVKNLVDHAPDLIGLLTGQFDTKTDQLYRFSRLISSRTIVNPDAILKQRSHQADPDLDTFLAQYSIRNKSEIDKLSWKWANRLEIVKRNRKNEVIDRDAEVLATIEFINKELELKHQRLVFITGDRAIYKAAKEYRNGNNDSNFARLYIRHPRVFIDGLDEVADGTGLHPESLSNGGKDNDNLGQWLYTFLAPIIERNPDVRIQELEKLQDMEDEDSKKYAAIILRNQPNIFDGFHAKQDNYVHHLAIRYTLEIGQLASKTASFISEAARIIDLTKLNLKDLLQLKSDEAWQVFFQVAIEGGEGLLMDKFDKDRPPIAIPPLRLKNHKEVQELVDKILASGAIFSQNELQDMLNTIKKQYQTSSGQYFYYLAFGIFFAAGGYWHITKILSRLALDIANSKQFNQLTGREAAYILAIAERLDSKQPGDLIRAIVMLGESRNRAEKDDLPGIRYDIRIDAEQCNVYLACHLFRIFLNMECELKDILPLEKCHERLFQLLNEINERELDLRVRIRTERQMLRSFFLIALLIKYRLETPVIPLSTMSENVIDELLKRFDNNMQIISSKDLPIPPKSLLDNAVYCASLRKFGKLHVKTIDVSEKQFSEETIEKYSITPYDKARFHFLTKLIFESET